LPATTDAEKHAGVQAVIDGFQSKTRSPRELFVKLEAHVGMLRGSIDPSERQLAGHINEYLARYKQKPWADRWIAARLNAFKPSKRLKQKIAPKLHIARHDWAAFPFMGEPMDRDLKGLFKRIDEKTTYTWQLYAEMDRVLYKLERSGADNLLRDKLAAYLADVRECAHSPFPQTVSPLPKANDPAVRKLIESRSYQAKTPREQFMMLEGTQLMLSQSKRPSERALAGKLKGYLDSTFRQIWRTDPSAKRELQEKIGATYAILARVVKPSVLAKLPKLTFVPVEGRNAVAAAYTDKPIIQVTKSTSIEDLLHEIGHIIEYKDFKTLARSHNVMIQRAFGKPAEGLQAIMTDLKGPGWNYSPSQRAFRGNATDPYILRTYKDGWTEATSMGVQQLQTKETAKKFFLEDGAHFLMTLSSLQSE
jgi:hypothetical protein